MEQLKPKVSKETAKSLIHQYYGLRIDEIEELNGYDDSNFYCKLKINEKQTIKTVEMTFKVTNHIETEQSNLMESLNDLSLYLHANGLHIPVPIKNLNGNYLERIELNANSKRRNAIRLFNFIPGLLLKNVDYTPGLLYKCGAEFAKLNKILTNYSNETIDKRHSFWALENALSIEAYLDELENSDHQSLVRTILKSFKNEILDKKSQFTEAIIHDDLNDQNLIVHKSNDGDYELAAILDFNDVNRSIRIFDIGIFCAYSMLNDKCTMNFMEMPKHSLSGYISNIEVSERELAILPIVIKTRLCQSLVLGNHFYRIDPTNEYLLDTSKIGWQVLTQLHAIDNRTLIRRWL